jgi:hypothetical protein
MVAPARQHFTFAAYLQVERDSRVRHEFLDGQVWAMARAPLPMLASRRT